MATKVATAANTVSLVPAPKAPELPEIIVSAPAETGLLPLAIHTPWDKPSGLPNVENSKLRSQLNALFQVFLSLPYLSCELPYNPPFSDISQFTHLVRKIHTTIPFPTDNDAEVDYSWLLRHTSFASSGSLSSNGLDVDSYELLITTMLDKIISQTRFGDRFFVEYDHPPLAIANKRKADSGIDLENSSNTNGNINGGKQWTVTFSESSETNIRHHTKRITDIKEAESYSASQKDQENNSPLRRRLTRRRSYTRVPGKGIPIVHYPSYLVLDVSSYQDNQMPNVLSLIKTKFGRPQTFFFCGPDTLLSNSTSLNRQDEPDKETMDLLSLPNYLAIVIRRSASDVTSANTNDAKMKNTTVMTKRYSQCTVEMPLDLDLLFLLKDQSNSVGETLYKLHGFMTYADNGNMVAITRCRESKNWYRCLDAEITGIDPMMGLNRVRSRGVVFCVYRLQERIIGVM